MSSFAMIAVELVVVAVAADFVAVLGNYFVGLVWNGFVVDVASMHDL